MTYPKVVTYLPLGVIHYAAKGKLLRLCADFTPEGLIYHTLEVLKRLRPMPLTRTLNTSRAQTDAR